MDIEIKLVSIHTVLAIVAGAISYLLYIGAIAGLKNEFFAVFAGLIILYLGGQLCERLFGKEEVGGMSGWLWNGIVPFFFVWILVWVILYNL